MSESNHFTAPSGQPLIRLITADDYDALCFLWASVPGMGLNDLDDSREGIARYLARNPATSFCAELGGELVGAIMAGHDGRRGFIYHTAVSPLHQGKGIGAALVQAAMGALESEGINKIALVVFARNERGNKFWESQGFTVRQDLTYRNKAIRP